MLFPVLSLTCQWCYEVKLFLLSILISHLPFLDKYLKRYHFLKFIMESAFSFNLQKILTEPSFTQAWASHNRWAVGPRPRWHSTSAHGSMALLDCVENTTSARAAVITGDTACGCDATARSRARKRAHHARRATGNRAASIRTNRSPGKCFGIELQRRGPTVYGGAADTRRNRALGEQRRCPEASRAHPWRVSAWIGEGGSRNRRRACSECGGRKRGRWRRSRTRRRLSSIPWTRRERTARRIF